MKRPVGTLLIAVVTLIVGAASPADAVIHGTPDGNGHPYVGVVFDFIYTCSGFAISPTVVVTAAHCFNQPDDVQPPGATVEVNFEPDPLSDPVLTFETGRWYPDPDFCSPCASGLPGLHLNDVAVVVLDEPVSLPRYATLPAESVVDSLSMGTNLTIVGYGIQKLRNIGPGDVFVREVAHTQLVASNDVIAANFIKMTANPAMDKGGVCFGDSGGPDLIEGTDNAIAINTFAANPRCAGLTYSQRLDLPAILDFIRGF